MQAPTKTSVDTACAGGVTGLSGGLSGARGFAFHGAESQQGNVSALGAIHFVMTVDQMLVEADQLGESCREDGAAVATSYHELPRCRVYRRCGRAAP